MRDQFKCMWTENEDGQWATGCGQIHEFMLEGPAENEYNYCPFCGQLLKPVYFQEDKR